MALVAKTYPLLEEAIEQGLKGIFMNEELEIAQEYRANESNHSAYENLLDRCVNRIMLEVDQRFDFTEFKG